MFSLLLTSASSIFLIALQFLDDVPIQMLGSNGQLSIFAHLFQYLHTLVFFR